MTLLSHLKARM